MLNNLVQPYKNVELYHKKTLTDLGEGMINSENNVTVNITNCEQDYRRILYVPLIRVFVHSYNDEDKEGYVRTRASH